MQQPLSTTDLPHYANVTNSKLTIEILSKPRLVVLSRALELLFQPIGMLYSTSSIITHRQAMIIILYA